MCIMDKLSYKINVSQLRRQTKVVHFIVHISGPFIAFWGVFTSLRCKQKDIHLTWGCPELNLRPIRFNLGSRG